ncbi:hypothetical protein B5K06_13285 [Rhizobium grahamii]|uniref:Cysteine rich repeat protein n=1 Tax=Rhizobium grahamii TaxID=1120045 RepID=A0A370KPK3_9HYPH|nr:hypothetical protein [Rhizobium grahamii]RDJ11264.1 hypothetical protein B5K06_13285 [Rhizobium grahamii]
MKDFSSSSLEVASAKHGLWRTGIGLSLLCAAALFAGAAVAQQPTDAQRNAIKSACRSDFLSNCSGVTPGGKEALACLQQHDASLSSGCKQALSALGGSGKAATPKSSSDASTAPAAPDTGATPKAAAPAAAAAPELSPREEMVIAREACGPDFRSYCRAVPLGGGRGIACLRENMQRLSPGCQKVLAHGL